MRRGYINPIQGFEECFPFEVYNEENSHCAVWHRKFSGDEAAIVLELENVSSRMSANFAMIKSFKSYHIAVHNIDEDIAIDGPWVPDYCKTTGLGYLFDRASSSNALLKM